MDEKRTIAGAIKKAYEDNQFLIEHIKNGDEGGGRISNIQLNGESAPVINKTVGFTYEKGTLPTYIQGTFSPGTLPEFNQGTDTYIPGSLNSKVENMVLELDFVAGVFKQGKDDFNPGTLSTHDEDLFNSGSSSVLLFDSSLQEQNQLDNIIMTAEINDDNTYTVLYENGSDTVTTLYEDSTDTVTTLYEDDGKILYNNDKGE